MGYHTGELSRRGRWAREGKFQNTPILAAGNLVVCTPFNRVVALDPASGLERWVYDPEITVNERPNERFNCRGLARWPVASPGSARPPPVAGGEAVAAPAVVAAPEAATEAVAAGGPPMDEAPPACAERLFMATTDRRIIALDALTGLPCADFGSGGQVSGASGAVGTA